MSNKKTWLFADYSQAEARIVAWRGPVPTLKLWFQTGQDIHLNVAKLIGKVVEDNKIKMPRGLWNRKPWQDLTKADDERQIGKTSVHSNNYEVGVTKFAQATGLPFKYAKIVQDIHHSIFPEIKNGYQKWIRDCLTTTRTVENPQGWRRTSYDNYTINTDAINRAFYAWYAQSAIGLLTINTFTQCCNVFDINNVFMVNTPTNIRNRGLDIQLQLHDNIGVVTDDDHLVIKETALTIKKIGEQSLFINDEPCIIPMDFKIGPSWGELRDYKLEEAV